MLTFISLTLDNCIPVPVLSLAGLPSGFPVVKGVGRRTVPCKAIRERLEHREPYSTEQVNGHSRRAGRLYEHAYGYPDGSFGKSSLHNEATYTDICASISTLVFAYGP
jgi:hypothetical protein